MLDWGRGDVANKNKSFNSFSYFMAHSWDSSFCLISWIFLLFAFLQLLLAFYLWRREQAAGRVPHKNWRIYYRGGTRPGVFERGYWGLRVGVVDTSSDPQTLSKTICSLFKEGQISLHIYFIWQGGKEGRERGGEGGKLTFWHFSGTDER